MHLKLNKINKTLLNNPWDTEKKSKGKLESTLKQAKTKTKLTYKLQDIFFKP